MLQHKSRKPIRVNRSAADPMRTTTRRTLGTKKFTPETVTRVPSRLSVYSQKLTVSGKSHKETRSLNSSPVLLKSKKGRAVASAKGFISAKKPVKHTRNLKIQQFVTQVEETAPSAEDIYKEHVMQTFLALKFIDTLPRPDFGVIKRRVKHLPTLPAGKRTVVFDLDETLVHCCNPQSALVPDVVLPVTLPDGQVANECLERASKLFEIIVFTASHKCYADQVVNYLDPGKRFIQHRFYRDDCMFVNGVHVKDLRVLGNRKLENVVIVDNAVYSFGYQLDNGIPIISWKSDPEDKELLNLAAYLERLAETTDMVKSNRKTFKLRQFYKSCLQSFAE